jgi:hypothetical protein
VAKQRNGPIGEIKLNWVGEYTRFQNLSGKVIDEYEDLAEHSNMVHYDARFNVNFPSVSDHIDTSDPGSF